MSWPNVSHHSFMSKSEVPFKTARIRKENTGLSHFKFVEDALVGFAAGHFGYWLNWVWNPSDSWAHCFL